MDIAHYIKHPEQLDRDTLYDLKSVLALYPFYQTARLLLLQNLYIMRDNSFDEELRRAAIYITDRKVLFNLVEAMHYQLKRPQDTSKTKEESKKTEEGSRTLSLIENFLETLPEEEENNIKPKRKPTPADAAVDYVAYLLDLEEAQQGEKVQQDTPQLKGHALIDNFINNEGGKIKLKEEPEFLPEEQNTTQNNENTPQNDFYTEKLARIYIQQGRYDKALEIIKQLSLTIPKKNAYFADQIRFLEKLILNNKTIK